MGTSTVSGPFRSQNGFQELVDGEWVPVSGGGSPLSLTTTGTSGPATLVGNNLNIPNYATGGGGDLAIPIISVAGNTTQISMPALEIGQSVTYVSQLLALYPTNGFNFTPASAAGVSAWAIVGATIKGGSVNTISGENTLNLPTPPSGSILWKMTFTRFPNFVNTGVTTGLIYLAAFGYQG
jgi:hypothetical protein